MKLIPIHIVSENNYDCFDILIHSICKWYKIDYQMMFSESWGFIYESIKDDSHVISKNLSVNRGKELYYLKKYHGIDIKRLEFNAETTKLIVEEIKNDNPVILKVDVYWCPWMFNHYKNQHTKHYIIINGYDKETGEFYCLDNQFGINGAKFPETDLLNASEEILFFRFDSEISEISSKDILNNAINRLSDDKGNSVIGERIESFSNDLINYMDLDEEVLNEKEPSTSLLFQLISQIGKGRYKFSLALEYIQNINNDVQLDSIINMLQSVAVKWDEVVAMLLKVYFIKNRTLLLNRINSKLMDIKNLEEDIVLNIKILIHDSNKKVKPNTVKIPNKSIEFNPRCYEYIDLRNYLNNNGVYNEESKYCNSELSNPNRYFVPNIVIENDEININRMRFKINNFTNDSYDNIACEGQEIEVNLEGCNTLMILMCSEFGNFDESIEIYYDNEEKEQIDIRVTSWLSSHPMDNNQISLSGKGVVRDKDNINVYPFDVHLYAGYYNLRHLTKLKKIKLPDCINIHVFAITLGK